MQENRQGQMELRWEGLSAVGLALLTEAHRQTSLCPAAKASGQETGRVGEAERCVDW